MRMMSRTTTNAQTTLERTMRTKRTTVESPREEETRELFQGLKTIERKEKANKGQATNSLREKRLPKVMPISPRREETARREEEMMGLEKRPTAKKKATLTMEDKPIVTITKKVELDTKVNVVVVREDKEVETITTTTMDLKTTTKDLTAETTREMKEKVTKEMLTTREVADLEETEIKDQEKIVNQESPESLESQELKVINLKETVEAATVDLDNPEKKEVKETKVKTVDLDNPEKEKRAMKATMVKKEVAEDAEDVVVVAEEAEEEAPVKVVNLATRKIEVTIEQLY
jgi:hypothetical protein